jgi:RNA polymerase sigma-32 factor
VSEHAERDSGVYTMYQVARSTRVLSASEEAALARAVQAGCEEAFEGLLRAHFRLVLAIARDLSRYGLPFEDLVREGMLGLVEAARRFDPERGVRLAAYAAWWIRAYMRRYTIDNRRIVRTPSSRHGRRLLASLRRTQHELAQALGAPPDRAAVATRLGVPVRDVDEMESALSGRDIPCGYDSRGQGHEPRCEAPSPESIVAEAAEGRAS